MEDKLTSHIQEIVRKEHDEALKLKERREFESTVSSLNHTIHEMYEKFKQLEKDSNESINEVDATISQLEVAKIRRDAISKQVEIEVKSLQELMENTENIQKEIWKLQNSLCESTQILSNECDISALMNKPFLHSVSLPKPTLASDLSVVPVAEIGQRMQRAIERRKMAIAERDRLLQLPESGEEFVRNLLLFRRIRREFSTKIEFNENEPIKFSTSPAAKRIVDPIVKYVDSDMPWYQPYVVIGSVAVFLIYFCILREENDVDRQFTKTLYERIDGLEKQQLLIAYKHYKEQGKNVEDIEKRLKEIEAAEAAQLRNESLV